MFSDNSAGIAVRGRFGGGALVPGPKVIPAFHAAKPAYIEASRQPLFPPPGAANAYMPRRFAIGAVGNLKQAPGAFSFGASFAFRFIAHFDPA
jgi:hypothetical protein